jgi:hypothetical protein
MNDVIKDFLEFLSDEYSYLLKIKLFLLEIPDLITNGNINELEFQGFLEKYEVETAKFVFEKNRHKELIANKLHIKPEQVTLKLLVHLGHNEFEEKGRKVLKISNDISMNLMKVAVYIRNFSKMQHEFQRLNNFLYQKDYTPSGVTRQNAYNYNRGRNYYGEA